MISSKEAATVIASEAERFVVALNTKLLEIRASASASEYERFRRAVGKIVGALEIELFAPLYQEHPELKPEAVQKARDDS